LAHSAANESMVIDPTWGNAADDKLFISNDQIGPFDVTAGAAIMMDVYIPAAYTTDTKLGFNFHIIDSANAYHWVGYQGVGWPIKGGEVNSIGFNTEGTADYGASFDSTDVTTVGLEIQSNGKALAVDGDIEIDNVQIVPTTEQPDDFSIATDSGWRTNPDNTPVISYEAGGVMATTTASDDQLVYDVTTHANLAFALVTFQYTVDQAFIDSGANLQPFAQLKGNGWPSTFCWVGNDSLTTALSVAYCTLGGALVDTDSSGFQIGLHRKDGTGSGAFTVNSMTISPVFE